MVCTVGVGPGAADCAKAAIAKPKVPHAIMALERYFIGRPPMGADHGMGGLNGRCMGSLTAGQVALRRSYGPLRSLRNWLPTIRAEMRLLGDHHQWIGGARLGDLVLLHWHLGNHLGLRYGHKSHLAHLRT